MRDLSRTFPRSMRGIVWWVVLIIVVVAIYVAGSAGSLGTSGTEVPGEPPRTCFTKCGFFMEFRCEDGKLIGACFPFWWCSAGVGPHQCTTSPSGDTGTSETQLAANCVK
jgi:hypothetical protein